MADRCWSDVDRELASKTLADYDRVAQVPLERHTLYAARAEALLDALTADGWHPPLRHGDPHMVSVVMGYELGLGEGREFERTRGAVASALTEVFTLLQRHQQYRPAHVDADTCAACNVGMEVVLWPCETYQAAQRIRSALNAEEPR